MFIFNSVDTFYKKPFGAVVQNSEVFFRAEYHRFEISRITAVFLIEETREELRIPMEWSGIKEGCDLCVCTLNVDFPPGLIWYYFETVDYENKILCWGRNKEHPTSTPQDIFQLTVYDKSFTTPDWFSKGVTYHIFVDRFNRGSTSGSVKESEDFVVHLKHNETPEYLPDIHGEILNRDIFGGDIRGITEKLSYIEALGVTTIYLSPIFEAWSNHKYNIADYFKIDEHFGTKNDFTELCEKAYERGIRIILDGVFSHTGSDSIYFNINNRYPGIGAAQSESSEYRKWFQFDEHGNYGSWWGIKTLPQTNELERSFLDYIVEGKGSVIEHWLKAGASGWRLDVADELPDEFIKRLRTKSRSVKEDSLVIGEVWEDASKKHAYGVRKKYFTDNVLDGVMNYPVKDAILGFLTGEKNAADVCGLLISILENYPKPVHGCLMNIIGTHDTVRAINALACRELLHESKHFKAEYKMPEEVFKRGMRLVKAAAILQFMYPGSPCVYYGDEIAMQGFEDPFNRRFFEWDGVNEDMLKFYRILGGLKKKNPIMHDGNFLAEEIDSDCIMITRKKNEAKVVSLVNRSSSEKYVYIPTKSSLTEIFEDKEYTPSQGGVRISLPGNANLIFETRI